MPSKRNESVDVAQTGPNKSTYETQKTAEKNLEESKISCGKSNVPDGPGEDLLVDQLQTSASQTHSSNLSNTAKEFTRSQLRESKRPAIAAEAPKTTSFCTREEQATTMSQRPSLTTQFPLQLHLTFPSEKDLNKEYSTNSTNLDLSVSFGDELPTPRSGNIIKLMILGEDNVGKTCFLMRWSENGFNKTHMPTIGVDYKDRIMRIHGKDYVVEIWDICGEEREDEDSMSSQLSFVKTWKEL